MGIAGYAHVTGDSDSARHHIKGLCKIVSLRGGVASFKENVKLLAEILRYDLLNLMELFQENIALTDIGPISG